MTRPKWLTVPALITVAATASLLSVAGAWQLGEHHVLENLTVENVSADTAAQAMQDDHFYSDYGNKILLVSGTVASVLNHGSSAEIVIRTNSATSLTCVLPGHSALPRPGESVSLLAVGASAQREPSAVVFPHCRSLAVR